MDYVRSRRIKLWGKARVVEDDPALLNMLRDSTYPGKVERAILFEIEAWDVNCPQHIHKRFPQKQVAPIMGAKIWLTRVLVLTDRQPGKTRRSSENCNIACKKSAPSVT